LTGVLLFQGLSGVAGGVGLVGDPSGASLGIPVRWLQGSPFADYMLPGLVLWIVLGVAPLVVAAGVWRRRAWGAGAAGLLGGALLVWIAVQIALIGYHPWPPLQLLYGGVGVALVGLASRVGR
jgi:hypothetical protein